MAKNDNLPKSQRVFNQMKKLHDDYISQYSKRARLAGAGYYKGDKEYEIAAKRAEESLKKANKYVKEHFSVQEIKRAREAAKSAPVIDNPRYFNELFGGKANVKEYKRRQNKQVIVLCIIGCFISIAVAVLGILLIVG